MSEAFESEKVAKVEEEGEDWWDEISNPDLSGFINSVPTRVRPPLPFSPARFAEEN